MRNLRNPQLERGEVRIEDIKLNHKCRDDMPTLLSGLQYLYSQEASRDRLFALLDEFILPGINKKVGRPGMDMWSILVLGLRGIDGKRFFCKATPAVTTQVSHKGNTKKCG